MNSASQRDVFDALGAPTATTCQRIERFGAGDDEKRICMDDIVPSSPCLMISVGSNNQWGFEEAVVARTHCTVKTYIHLIAPVISPFRPLCAHA